jgi:type VI secretion system protein ImpA
VRQALVDGAARIERIDTAFRAIDETLMARAGSSNATDFTPLYDVLVAQKLALRNFLPAPVLEEAEPETAADADAQGESGATQLTSGTVRSREDVLRLLELVLDYYRRHEPSSPVPMLIERACGWIGLDFMAVLEDIAPSAVGDAHTILRLRGQ